MPNPLVMTPGGSLPELTLPPQNPLTTPQVARDIASTPAPAPPPDAGEPEMPAPDDTPEGKSWAKDLYPLIRKHHPDVHPDHVKSAIRDAYHAVKNGFMDSHMAGLTLGHMARSRHLKEKANARQQ